MENKYTKKIWDFFCKSPATIFELDTNLIYISFLRSLHNICVLSLAFSQTRPNINYWTLVHARPVEKIIL